MQQKIISIYKTNKRKICYMYMVFFQTDICIQLGPPNLYMEKYFHKIFLSVFENLSPVLIGHCINFLIFFPCSLKWILSVFVTNTSVIEYRNSVRGNYKVVFQTVSCSISVCYFWVLLSSLSMHIGLLLPWSLMVGTC